MTVTKRALHARQVAEQAPRSDERTIVTPLDVLYRKVQARPKGIAFLWNDEVWSYERLAIEAERLALGLASRGLRSGDRVVLHMMNRPEMIVAYYACFRLGTIAVPFWTAYKAAELDPLLRRLRPALYIGEAGLYKNVANTDSSILAADVRFLIGGTADDPRAQPWAKLFGDTGGKAAFAPTDLDPDAPAVLINTSGTTGQLKFVVHTPTTLSASADLFAHLGLNGDQIAINALPMAHISGLLIFLALIRFGAPFVLLERFDPDAVLDMIERHRCTWLPLMPPGYAALLERQQAQPRDVGSLQTCGTSGDVCPQRLQDQFPAFFGVPLRSFWAATETLGSFTFGLVSGPVSRVVKGTEFRLVDDDGLPVPRGEVGELLLRGPNVSIGYWNGPGDIDAPPDGWYHTGDLMRQGYRDDFWFVSRKKDLIIRGGTNISPVEVEQLLAAAHPDIRDAAVVGVPDPVLGQRVVGFVVLDGGARDTILDEIRIAMAPKLADYKLPERLFVVKQIPRNALGKTDRNALLRQHLTASSDALSSA